VVLRLILADCGGVLVEFGAVQEHRGDERGGFLDAGYVLGDHAGRGLEQRDERPRSWRNAGRGRNGAGARMTIMAAATAAVAVSSFEDRRTAGVHD
jgi:hypothetical protein